MFITAIGLAEVNDARLKAMLLQSLGSKVQRIFHVLGPAEKYADCVAFLAGHFVAPQLQSGGLSSVSADSGRVSRSTSKSPTSSVQLPSVRLAS